jgi:alkanesulfonate monooxygenase SsuD/methylene tetrahydromethanopterin reductase-like flavin-dependent oxidoreductase (luciferase family)
VLRFVRLALTGDKVTEDFETFSVRGFRLGLIPEVAPQLLVAGLREQMLRLAGRHSDGAIINWLGANDVAKVAQVVNDEGDDREIVCRIFVCPSEDAETVRAAARFAIASYLNVPVYADFHRWLGREAQLTGMWDAWAAGDRKAALAAIPDEVVDDLIVWGSPDQCRAKIDAYFANGVTTSSLALLSLAKFDYWEAVEALAPLRP